MRLRFAVPAALLALAIAVPALAGGDHCASHSKNSAASAGADACCSAKGSATAWSGAWLERSEDGALTVAAVAEGSPAARSGLRKGDIVLAVNGYHMGNESERAACIANKACTVGSAMSYKIQRGRSTKSLKLKLTSLPAEATARYAERQAAFEPDLAAVVMPASR